ncbi:type 1 glutamine amidotransferase domain-containing protein [Tengunoibacter tsumagoiensis]|uniref:Protease n=1 Tax=Tengunoibacter tsumagoiensis TaxID=2014871 RepID=A0A402A5F9_9CHLR|nr:type 1 glutamine amidotransferase domain-containing protein [Tengunoibacter tsumagoiensis]GCE14383.1 protease [Tengunoibacter tsumagoiensis]
MQNVHKLTGMRVAILVTDDFEQAEMTEPKKALEHAGAQTMIISTKPGQVTGVNHDVKADSFPVDKTLDEVKPEEFDAVLLPGGAINADTLRMEGKAQNFVKTINSAGRPIAVICHAPWLLISAGCVNGRKMTSYYTIQDDLKNAGAHWVDQEVVRDGNWVSSRSPKDLPAFNSAMVALFAESKNHKLQPSQDIFSA